MDADPAGNTIIFDLLLLLFFTLLNAYFAGAEMAVVSVNKNRIRSLAEEGNKKAKVIEGLFEDSTKFLSPSRWRSHLRDFIHRRPRHRAFRRSWRSGCTARESRTAGRLPTTA